MVDVAKEVGADAVAHGCTGKGNDQVCFRATLSMLLFLLKLESFLSAIFLNRRNCNEPNGLL